MRQAQFGEGGAGGDAQLHLYQVDAGDRFGDAVLHLDARVGLHEHEVATRIVDEEFEGADAAIAGLGCQGQGGVEDALAQRRVEPRCGRDLDDLLVAPLQAAIAFPQVADRLAVTDHLHLDVPGLLDQPLDVERVVAEGGARFRLAARVGLFQLGGIAHRAHAPAAAGQGRA